MGQSFIIGKRTRPRISPGSVLNQQTWELISVRRVSHNDSNNVSHNYSNNDLSGDVPLVEFIILCSRSHARLES